MFNGPIVREVQNKSECWETEKYEECASDCHDSCLNYKQETAKRSCSKMCATGCMCKEGYVRIASLECVTPDKCPQPISDSSENQTN
ncbi:scavenger receptor cysteine-rich protein-like protein [Leptotrombidium deliense]|uniref:Scavenger receptor cysteine-rich protein-like protein n=1 Tax=Leptotrombidium deliense TaxID=299467 RepID=A0A443RSS7_9ACAR|nr:scavenger receptor cysteine-rich protein-like protein [Leptotrombidium deliense]